MPWFFWRKSSCKFNLFFAYIAVLVGTDIVVSDFALSSEKNNNEAIAYDLALFIREARSVVSKRPKFIHNPSAISMTPEQFLQLTEQNFSRSFGKDSADRYEETKQLKKSIYFVIKQAISGNYKLRWAEGLYQGKFLPARFASEVALHYSQTPGNYITVKLTAPDRFLVNEKNESDDWERKVFNTHFLKDWPKNKSYTEVVTSNKKKIFRFMLPEYYKRDCIGCHGGSEGRRIHKGKVSGILGDIGGAISVSITLNDHP